MIHRPGLRAVLIREPWSLDYQLLMGDDGQHPFRAVGVEGGRIIYQDVERHAITEPFLTLSVAEFEALAKALLAEQRPEDATLDALKDARQVRDRLLTLVERRPS